MTPATEPYCCAICDAAWSYEAVQYVARCPACGGTLLRREDAPKTQPRSSGRRLPHHPGQRGHLHRRTTTAASADSNTTSRRRRPQQRNGQESERWAGIIELRREVSELRRTNNLRGSHPYPARGQRSDVEPRKGTAGRSRRRFGLVLGAGAVVVIVLVASINHGSGNPASFPVPSNARLARMSMRQRIVAIADSQIGYVTNPDDSYCNKFSAYWDAGTADCPSGERSEEWCADFAAWAWEKAGVRFTYGYGPAEINAGAVSFYQWGLARGQWHAATSSYRPVAGDVAVYGLSLGQHPSAAHVAIVTDDPPGQRGPDVINGDGARTGFSVVETGTKQLRADAPHHDTSALAGYVSLS